MRPIGSTFLLDIRSALALMGPARRRANAAPLRSRCSRGFIHGLLVLGVGCDSAAPPAPVATTIAVSPVNAILEDLGETAQLIATVTDQNGEIMPGVEVAWSSGDPGVAQVRGDGLVTGGVSGTANVTASADALTAVATITVKEGQRAVLHMIYRDMGGERWNNSANWTTSAPLDTWYGVDTDTDGNITRLDLMRNGLAGSISPEVGRLQTLKFLSFSENRLTDAIPPEIADLRNLRTLNMASNELTGSIPPQLGRLPYLLGLYLAGNGLTGSIPPELGGLSFAYELDLSGNELTGSIPPELDGLHGIFELDLSGNGLTGSIPPEIGGLGSRLSFGPWILDLSMNQLTGSIPSQLGNLASLRQLDLSRNELTGSIPSRLGSLVNLRRLDLSENDLADLIPSQLGNLRFLSVLDLSQNDVTGPVPKGLGRLRTLTGLSIFGNPLNGPLPAELVGVPLELFHWHETGLCAPADAAFQEWLNTIGDHSGKGNCDS